MEKQHLQHYGIKGMRWGVRRKRDPKTGRVESKDSKTARLLSRKKLSEMSNDELKTLTTRLQLERQYRDLKKKDTSPGKKFVSEVLANSGKQLVSKYVAKAGEAGIENLIKTVKNKN